MLRRSGVSWGIVVQAGIDCGAEEDITRFVTRQATKQSTKTTQHACWTLRSFLRFLRYEDCDRRRLGNERALGEKLALQFVATFPFPKPSDTGTGCCRPREPNRTA